MLRRTLALIVLTGLASAAAGPLAAAAGRPGTMTCCRGGSKMACCVPSAGCEMKSCSGGDRDAIFPGLAPAVFDSLSCGIELAPCLDQVTPLRAAVVTFDVVPPDQPPRG